MKKLLLLASLALHLNSKGQILTSNATLCDGQSTTLYAPAANSLATTLSGGNNHRGNMFDLVAINTLTINSFDAHPMGNTTIEIYYKAGTYSGFNTSPASWTLVGAASVTAQPFGSLTPVPIPVNVVIPAGQTYAFYITSTITSVSLNYSNGTTVGAVYASDANLQFLEGIGLEYPFTGIFSPRIWNGRINYSTASNTYTWSTGANTSFITVSPSVTTTYSVAVNSSTNVSALSVSVNPSPTVTVNSGTICSGNSFSIIPSGADTYTIEGGSTDVSPLTNTSYTVLGMALNGCANTATSNLIVNTTPTVSVNDGTICSGNSFSILPSGADTYTIEGGSSTVSPLTNSSYTVNGISVEGCPSANTATSYVVVNTTPTVTVNSGIICSGQSFTITPGGTDTYSISGGSTVVSPNTTSTYSVTGTSSLGCVSGNTVISTVTVVATPTITVNSGAVCTGQTFSIIPGGATSYTFSNGSSTVVPTTNSTYSVTGSSGPGCLSTNTAVSSVTVNALPILSASSNASLICNTESAMLTTTGAVTYTLNGNATTSVTVISPTITTSYTISGTDANGCKSSTTFTQNVTECTGFAKPLQAEALLNIFPNPSNGIYTIESENKFTISIYDALGKLVFSNEMPEGKNQVDLSMFKNGLYTLKAENNNQVRMFRLIKE